MSHQEQKTPAAQESLHSRWFRARMMALTGFVTRVIIIETGLSDKQCRRLYRELELEGYDLTVRKNTRTTRSSAIILRNQTAKAHASLLMQIYRLIGKDQIYLSVCIQSLVQAYSMYHALIREVSELDDKSNLSEQSFSITDAWCLSSELRSQEAFFDECRKCGCDFFTSFHQSTVIECPFCRDWPSSWPVSTLSS